MLSFIDKCSQNRDRVFAIDPFRKTTLTYGQIMRKALNLAVRLKEYGIKKSDRVVLLFDNQLECIIANFSLLYLGAVIVPLNPSLSQNEMNYILNHVEPDLILSNIQLSLSIKDIGKKAFVITDKVLDCDDYKDISMQETIMSYDDPIAILYTSGSTGKPKGVVWSYGSVISEFTEYGNTYFFDQNTRFIQSMPVYHGDGWCHSVLCPFLFNSSVILLPVFNMAVAGMFDEILSTFGGNTLIAVPSMLSALMMVKRRFLKPVEGIIKFVLCGSDRLHDDVREKFEQEFKTRVFENYGLTETLLISYFGPENWIKSGSVGKISDKCEVQISEEGEIQIKSPYLFKEYFKDEKLTNQVFDNGWFCTGDIGYYDEDRYLFLNGRKKEIINKAGYKIDPNEINNILISYNGVIDSATIGISDTVYGEEVYSFVVFNDHTNCNAELFEYVRNTLSTEKWPKYIFILEMIPRNSIGKIIKAELQESVEKIMRESLKNEQKL